MNEPGNVRIDPTTLIEFLGGNGGQPRYDTVLINGKGSKIEKSLPKDFQTNKGSCKIYNR